MTRTAGEIHETQNSQLREKIELATSVKIKDISKELVENIKDGVPNQEERLKSQENVLQTHTTITERQGNNRVLTRNSNGLYDTSVQNTV